MGGAARGNRGDRGDLDAIDVTGGEFGHWAVADTDLAVDRIPPGPDPWMPFAEFALSFDGYVYRADLGRWANPKRDAYLRRGSLPSGLSLRDLRALVFFEQRRWRHLEATPTGAERAYIGALLDELRRRVAAAAGGKA